MKYSSSSKGYLLVTISGAFFGLSGFFVETLSRYHVPLTAMGFFRPLIGFLIFFLYILIKNPAYLKVDLKGLSIIALLGLNSQALFNRLYFTSIERTSIATAVVLLYTAPIIVALLARFIYKEPLNPPKIIALVVSVSGCFLTATGGSLAVLKLNSVGLLSGLGAGLTFALLPLINKKIAGRYHYLTIACYIMGFGALFSLLFMDPRELFLMDYSITIWGNLIALGFLSNAMAFLFYTAGMSHHNIQTSKASIISTIEVPVAVLTSYLFLQENIFGIKMFGILLVILSVVIIEYGEQLLQSLKSKTKEGLIHHRIP